MKGIIIFTIILVAIILGHDFWVAYDKGLPFALSDLGWVVNTYLPDAESYIMDNTSEYVQTFITILFNLTTLIVVSAFMGVILVLSAFFTLSNKMGEINVFEQKEKKSGSLLKRDRKKKMQYKRK